MEQSPPQRTPRGWAPHVHQHLGPLATAAFFALVAARVLSVSRGQARTATVLLSSSPGQVGLATLVSALPFLLYLGAAALAIASATDSSPLRRRRNYLLIVVLVFLALGSSSLLLAVAGIPPSSSPPAPSKKDGPHGRSATPC